MPDWKSHLKAAPVDWLLDPENPSVRYLTLTEILKKPKSDPEVVQARSAIMETGPVPSILALQNPEGYWEAPDAYYTSKYKGTSWQLIVLAEHFADGADSRIRKACEFILEKAQDQESGGFSVHHAAKTGGGRHSEVVPCLTGNLVWSLIRLGFFDDPRVRKGVEWITRFQRFDDGIPEAPAGWPYDKFEICWGSHTCHMGVVKSLKALSEIPADKRSGDVQAAIDKAVDYLLAHHIYKKSHDLNEVSKPGWLRFGFPLMYQTDVLEILDILTKLGVHDSRMAEAVEIVISKQDSQGRWKLANSFNESFSVPIEEKGSPSRWITFKAMKVIKGYFS